MKALSASKGFYQAAIEEARTSCAITIASRDYLTVYLLQVKLGDIKAGDPFTRSRDELEAAFK